MAIVQRDVEHLATPRALVQFSQRLEQTCFHAVCLERIVGHGIASASVCGNDSPFLGHVVADIEPRTVGLFDEDVGALHFADEATALRTPDRIPVFTLCRHRFSLLPFARH